MTRARTETSARILGYQAIKEDLLGKMYLRMVSTREGLEPIPPELSRLETIHWCLVPRDVPVPKGFVSDAVIGVQPER